MQIPVRLAESLRWGRSTAVLLSLGFCTVVFISTPFLIPEVSARFGVGAAGGSLLGVGQLGGFVVGSAVAGRTLTPTRRVLASALVSAIIVNAASIALPPLEILLVLRFLSGIGLGVITWFAWANAFSDKAKITSMAAVGPMIGVAGTPVVAVVIDRFGMQGLFLLLAVLPVAPLLLVRHAIEGVRRDRLDRRPMVVAAKRILFGLAAFSFGGSAVFQLAVTIGVSELGLTSNSIAIGFTCNSVLSIVGAKWGLRRGPPGMWMGLTAASAFLVASAFSGPVFFVALIVWGFSYWMAIPAIYVLLADVSAFPEERAGDAQTVMALGRAIGPVMGGALLDGRAGAIGLASVASAFMLTAALVVFHTRISAESLQPVSG